MSAHVLLNLLIELRISDQNRGLLSNLLLFRNLSNKFSYTGARMLDDTKLLWNLVFTQI